MGYLADAWQLTVYANRSRGERVSLSIWSHVPSLGSFCRPLNRYVGAVYQRELGVASWPERDKSNWKLSADPTGKLCSGLAT